VWEDAQTGSHASIQDWKSRLITLGADVTGRAIDVRSDGALIIETADGRHVTVEAGDVSLNGSIAPEV